MERGPFAGTFRQGVELLSIPVVVNGFERGAIWLPQGASEDTVCAALKAHNDFSAFMGAKLRRMVWVTDRTIFLTVRN